MATRISDERLQQRVGLDVFALPGRRAPARRQLILDDVGGDRRSARRGADAASQRRGARSATCRRRRRRGRPQTMPTIAAATAIEAAPGDAGLLEQRRERQPGGRSAGQRDRARQHAEERVLARARRPRRRR